jgi:hypothetical protein
LNGADFDSIGASVGLVRTEDKLRATS